MEFSGLYSEIWPAKLTNQLLRILTERHNKNYYGMNCDTQLKILFCV